MLLIGFIHTFYTIKQGKNCHIHHKNTLYTYHTFRVDPLSVFAFNRDETICLITTYIAILIRTLKYYINIDTRWVKTCENTLLPNDFIYCKLDYEPHHLIWHVCYLVWTALWAKVIHANSWYIFAYISFEISSLV